MAVTGKTWIPVEPGKRKVGALLHSMPEGSSQTFPAGALLMRSAGYLVMHTTSNVSTSWYGWAAESGHNQTADGLKEVGVWRAQADAPFKIVASGTVANSQLGGAFCLSQSTDGHCFVITAAASAASSALRIIEFGEGFVAGDTNPVVLFVPLAPAIQETV